MKGKERMIVLKDANGNYVPVEEKELMEAIEKGILYGMSMNCVCEFKELYIEYGGKQPITVASIREFFDILTFKIVKKEE